MKIDKKDYPKMPDDIKDMIKQQVENEIFDSETKVRPVAKRRFVRYAVAALAGTLLVGTTVYAASKLISITTEKKGEYGLETKVTVSENVDGGEEKENLDNVSTENENIIDGTAEASYDREELMQEVNYVQLDIGYLPEDIYVDWTDEDLGVPKLFFWSNEDRENRHFTFYMWRIHEGVEYVHNDVNVINTEEFEVPGGTAVLVELNDGMRKVYMAYDIGYVLDIWSQPGMTKEEMINVAKGIKLNVVTKEEAEGLNPVMEAPAYLPPEEYAEENVVIVDDTLASDFDLNTKVAKDELMVYQVGDNIAMPKGQGQYRDVGNITASVTKVEVCDDLSVINKDVFNYFQGENPDFIDGNGNLKDETVSYCKVGDGVNSLDETVATETIPVKLVYIEVEYSSDTGGTDMLFYGSIMLVKEDENSYEIYDGLSQLARETEYDVAYPSYYDNVPDEIYFYNGNDVWEKNHFESIQAGETRTASYCFVVREDWLPYMYFDITGADYPDQFEKTVIKTGLIDIRQ